MTIFFISNLNHSKLLHSTMPLWYHIGISNLIRQNSPFEFSPKTFFSLLCVSKWQLPSSQCQCLNSSDSSKWNLCWLLSPSSTLLLSPPSPLLLRSPLLPCAGWPSVAAVYIGLLLVATSGHLHLLFWLEGSSSSYQSTHLNSSVCSKITTSKSLPWAHYTKYNLTLHSPYLPLFLPHNTDRLLTVYLFMSFSCCLNPSSQRVGTLSILFTLVPLVPRTLPDTKQLFVEWMDFWCREVLWMIRKQHEHCWRGVQESREVGPNWEYLGTEDKLCLLYPFPNVRSELYHLLFRAKCQRASKVYTIHRRSCKWFWQ